AAALAGDGGVQQQHVEELRERQRHGEPLQRAHPPPARGAGGPRRGGVVDLPARHPERQRGGRPRGGAERRRGGEPLRPPRRARAAAVVRRGRLRRDAQRPRQRRERCEVEPRG
ncbi:Os10g0464350, partial [Oryza sativa Japonica Group]